jgi:hypothetical protein
MIGLLGNFNPKRAVASALSSPPSPGNLHDVRDQSMIRKSVQRFSEKIMLNQKTWSAMAIQPYPIVR